MRPVTTLLGILLLILIIEVRCSSSTLKIWPDEDDAPFGPYDDGFASNSQPSSDSDEDEEESSTDYYVDTSDPIVPTKPEIDHTNPQQQQCDSHPIFASSSVYFTGNTELIYTDNTPDSSICPNVSGTASCCSEWTLYQLDVSLTSVYDSLINIATTVGNFPSDLREQVTLWESATLKVGFINTGWTVCSVLDQIGYRICDIIYNLATSTASFAKSLHDNLKECVESIYEYYNGVACLMCDPDPSSYITEGKNDDSTKKLYQLAINSNMAEVVANQCNSYFNIQVEWMQSVADSLFSDGSFINTIFGLKKRFEKIISKFNSKSLESIVTLTKSGLAGIYVDQLDSIEFFGGIKSVMEFWTDLSTWITSKLSDEDIDTASLGEELRLFSIQLLGDDEEEEEEESVFDIQNIVNIWDDDNHSFDPLLQIMDVESAQEIQNSVASINRSKYSSSNLVTTILIVVGAIGLIVGIVSLLVWKKGSSTLFGILKRRNRAQYVSF